MTRRERVLKPMWKRLDQYQAFAAAFQVAAQNPSRDEFFAGETELAEWRHGDAVRFLNAALAERLPRSLPGDLPYQGGEVALFERVEQEVRRVWDDAPGLVMFTYKSGMQPGPSPEYALIDAATGAPSLDIRGLSAQVAGLDEVWAGDTQAWAFLVEGHSVDGTFNPGTQDYEMAQARDGFAKALAEVLLDPAWIQKLIVGPSIDIAGERS